MDGGANDRIGKIPEKNLFLSHSPLKNDKRKIALELYLGKCQEHLENMQPLIEFLCSDMIERMPSVSESRVKLTQRYVNL